MIQFVIGGGPCTYNPEPIAEFFDLFYIGEGETVYDQLLDIYKENKKMVEADGIIWQSCRGRRYLCSGVL